MLKSGGFVMWPLLACSLVSWVVIFERAWSFRKVGAALKHFQLEAMNTLLRGDWHAIRGLCHKHHEIPTARMLMTAVDRMDNADARVQATWKHAFERRRQMENQELRSRLWMLGTIGAASPFIGLFGTVVGILRSFQEMAKSGSGGFTVVAAGISEALIATAVGIVVAVIAVMSFNAFQTRAAQLVLSLKLQAEELAELLETAAPSRDRKSG